VHRRDNSATAIKYIKGLLSCEKGQANMERMEEEIHGSEYRAYQHFIANSKWGHEALMGDISMDVSGLLEENKKEKGHSTGYLIDESAHLKKGEESVGVSRQYAGVVGKVENCQVGVYASVVNGTRATMVNARLYLPKCWTDDAARCGKAKIPKDKRVYKTKPQLALEMIGQDVSNGVSFDWIGGDGLYGHNSELTRGLEERGHFYVLDVHKDERVFLKEPGISLPAKKPGKGRPPSGCGQAGI
jgi:SRSO17 transposase